MATISRLYDTYEAAAEAMRNLDVIVSTPGLDAVYIGPADLAIGLTGDKYPPGFDREEPELVEAIRTILSSAHRAGIRAALHCGSASYAAKAIRWGFDLVTVSNDVRLLSAAAAASVRDFRSAIAETPTAAYAQQSGMGY